MRLILEILQYINCLSAVFPGWAPPVGAGPPVWCPAPELGSGGQLHRPPRGTLLWPPARGWLRPPGLRRPRSSRPLGPWSPWPLGPTTPPNLPDGRFQLSTTIPWCGVSIKCHWQRGRPAIPHPATRGGTDYSYGKYRWTWTAARVCYGNYF